MNTRLNRLCVGIQKGGVGKTTSSVNLADCLARLTPSSEKILLIDMDAQRSSSKLLGIQDGTTPGLRDLLMLDDMRVQDVIHATRIPRLYIIPSSLKLAPVESMLMIPGEFESPIFRLYSKLTPEAVSEFRYVIIDTPPSMGPLMMNALGASDLLIAPMESGSGFSFDGIDDLLKIVTLVKSEQLKHIKPPYHTDLQLLGVLLTKHDKRQTLCKAVHSSLLNKYKDDVMHTTIAMSAAVKKAEIEGQTLMQNDRKSTAARDYMQLAEEVIRRVEAREADLRSQPQMTTAEPAVVA